MSYEHLGIPRAATFLVTGGAGFIGSNLCEAILMMGNAVRCLDDLSTGKQANIEPFLASPRFEFVLGDIRDYETCFAAVQDVDYVLHQAAWGSVPRSIEFPMEYEDVNVRGTLSILEAARHAGVRRFVYASSSSVYGDTDCLPRKEGREGRVLSPYACTKRACEDYGRLYAELYDLSTIGLRYFNVFGRRQDPNGQYAAVIPAFIRMMLSGEVPVIHGDGHQSRDFTYVENVVEANLRACQASGAVSGAVMNIAFGEQEELLQVCQLLAKELGVDVAPRFGPERQGDVRHSHADITRARELLGYDPAYSFAKGIRLAIDWYRLNLG